MSTIRIAIAGASGRMGKMLIEAVLASPHFELAGALDREQSPALGKDAGESMGRLGRGGMAGFACNGSRQNDGGYGFGLGACIRGFEIDDVAQQELGLL